MRCVWFFFFQAEDGIRDLVRSRGLGDVYKRQQLAAWAFFRASGQARSVAPLKKASAPEAARLVSLSLIHI